MRPSASTEQEMAYKMAYKNEKRPVRGVFAYLLAEAVRFELTEGSHLRRFSRPVHSTTLPRFQLNSASIVMRLLPAFASGLRQKQRLQIAQEVKAALGGHHALEVARN